MPKKERILKGVEIPNPKKFLIITLRNKRSPQHPHYNNKQLSIRRDCWTYTFDDSWSQINMTYQLMLTEIMGWFIIDLELTEDWFEVLTNINCSNVGCRLINK